MQRMVAIPTQGCEIQPECTVPCSRGSFCPSQAAESIKMLVTLCQSDNEEIRKVASETLLSLGELPVLKQYLIFFLKTAACKTPEL